MQTILMKRNLADQLMESFMALYLSATIGAKGVDSIDDLTEEDFETAHNYARSKFVGITAEFEYDNFEWCIVD